MKALITTYLENHQGFKFQIFAPKPPLIFSTKIEIGRHCKMFFFFKTSPRIFKLNLRTKIEKYIYWLIFGAKIQIDIGNKLAQQTFWSYFFNYFNRKHWIAIFGGKIQIKLFLVVISEQEFQEILRIDVPNLIQLKIWMNIHGFPHFVICIQECTMKR